MKSLSLKTVAALCAGASVLSIAAAGFAQDGPRPPGRPGFAAGAPRDAKDARFAGQRGPDRAAFQAERQKRLHDLLQITPAQEGAFQAWQSAMRPPERPDRPDRDARARMTTPQRLDARLAMIDRRAADMHARAEATKRFYAQLSPTQRTAMDSLPPMMGRMGPGGHGRGGPGMHRGGPGGRHDGFGPGRPGPGPRPGPDRP